MPPQRRGQQADLGRLPGPVNALDGKQHAGPRSTRSIHIWVSMADQAAQLHATPQVRGPTRT
jgi:hypothetical protein